MLRSLIKSWKLVRIERELSAPHSSRDIISAALSGQESKLDIAEKKLLDLVLSDRNCVYVLNQHGESREKLKELYSLLIYAGAGQVCNGHFVAASALCFPATLDYLLKETSKETFDANNIAIRMIRYFEDGEVGLVT